MADVTVVCSGCGVKVVASEFADSVACRSCGKVTPVRAPAGDPMAGSVGTDGVAKPAGMKLRDGVARGVPLKPSAIIEEMVKRVQARAGGRQRRTNHAECANHPLVAWGVFLVLGGLCAWARFGNLLPPVYQDMLKTWGPVAALFFHVVVLFKAFDDSVFYGSLCLLLPPYTFYYLFAICDIFVLRALYMGVLAGVGMDTFFAVKRLSIEVYIAVSSWIIYGS